MEACRCAIGAIDKHTLVLCAVKKGVTLDEFADILAYNKKFQKQAEWLRSVINKDAYTQTKTINAEAIRKANEILESSEITNAFDKAIAQLSVK